MQSAVVRMNVREEGKSRGAFGRTDDYNGRTVVAASAGDLEPPPKSSRQLFFIFVSFYVPFIIGAGCIIVAYFVVSFNPVDFGELKTAKQYKAANPEHFFEGCDAPDRFGCETLPPTLSPTTMSPSFSPSLAPSKYPTTLSPSDSPTTQSPSPKPSRSPVKAPIANP